MRSRRYLPIRYRFSTGFGDFAAGFLEVLGDFSVESRCPAVDPRHAGSESEPAICTTRWPISAVPSTFPGQPTQKDDDGDVREAVKPAAGPGKMRFRSCDCEISIGTRCDANHFAQTHTAASCELSGDRGATPGPSQNIRWLYSRHPHAPNVPPIRQCCRPASAQRSAPAPFPATRCSLQVA